MEAIERKIGEVALHILQGGDVEKVLERELKPLLECALQIRELYGGNGHVARDFDALLAPAQAGKGRARCRGSNAVARSIKSLLDAQAQPSAPAEPQGDAPQSDWSARELAERIANAAEFAGTCPSVQMMEHLITEVVTRAEQRATQAANLAVHTVWNNGFRAGKGAALEVTGLALSV